MERWSGKVAVVTGASAGIGAAIAIDLAKAGVRVVGLARRPERIDELKKQLSSSIKDNFHSFKCDVTSEADIKAAFKWTETNFGGTDILINNAGIGGIKMNIVDNDNTEQLKAHIDTNVMGPALCIREAFQSMKSRNIDGHVIIINSVLGHNIPYLIHNRSMNMYPPTKFAVTAMTEVLRQEFQLLKTKIKITSISPGIVETEIFQPKELEYMKAMEIAMLKSEDISAAVLYVLGTPPHVQVHELTIRPVGEKF